MKPKPERLRIYHIVWKLLKMSHLNFWHFPSIFVLLKLTCLVTLFDRKLQVFKNSTKWTIFGIFNQLLSTRNVNAACNVEWDFFCDFQTPWYTSKVYACLIHNLTKKGSRSCSKYLTTKGHWGAKNSLRCQIQKSLTCVCIFVPCKLSVQGCKRRPLIIIIQTSLVFA